MYFILKGCMYTTDMGFVPNSSIGKIEKTLTRANNNKRNINDNINNVIVNRIKVGNITINDCLIRKVDIKIERF